MTHNQKRSAQQAFLASFECIGVVRRAATNAGVSRRTVYNWLTSDGQFQERFQEAMEEHRDLIREEIHRRAIEGRDEPVYHQGEVVGTIRKYSDALLLRMARARLPEYRDADQRANEAVPASGADGVATEIIVEVVEVGAS